MSHRVVRWALAAALVSGFSLGGCRSKEPDDSEFRTQRAERQTAEQPVEPGATQQGEGEGESVEVPAAPTEPAADSVDTTRLMNPGEEEEAPATYAVQLTTTEGPVVIDVTRAWAPNGADRFYNLVKLGYFTDVAFFRVIEGFMAQAGIHGDPNVNRFWTNRTIDDDPVEQSNTRGMVTFATAGPNTRANQFFINFGDNSRLDGMGFSPFGKVRDMAPVDRIHSGYGESAPRGRGPRQGDLSRMGNTYLRSQFPDLDYIQSARVIEENGQPVSEEPAGDD